MRFRYSVSSFLIGVALLAAAFGALESNSSLVGSLVFSINLALLCLALVGALVAKENKRIFWIGFIVCGGLYSLVAFGFLFPTQPNNNYGYIWFGGYAQPQINNERPHLITTRILDLYASLRAPRSIGDRVSSQWSGGGYWPSTIVAYKDGRYQVKWDDPSAPEWVAPSQIQPVGRDLTGVGHSIFSLFFAFLGGLAALAFFAPREPHTKPEPSAPIAATSSSDAR